MRTVRRWGIGGRVGLVVALGLSPLATTARAQDSSILTASGEQLYQAGKKLYAEGKYPEACARFLASQAADPASGTLYYLGLCYEKVGKTATAYGSFLDAVSFARREGGAASGPKIEAAQAKADALAPKLAHLTLVVPVGDAAPSKIEGLRITRDDIALEPALWAVPLPIDVGDHTLEVSAPGYVTWQSTVTIKRDGEAATVSIPPLVKEQPKPEPPGDEGVVAPRVTPPPPTPTRLPAPIDAHGADSTRRTLEWTAGTIGAVGIVTGAGFGLLALSHWNSAKPNCPSALCSTPSAQSEAVDARRYGDVSTVAFVVGAAGAISTVVLLLTTPSAHAQPTSSHLEMSPLVGQGSVGFIVGGRF